jgi:HlyD family secretion protein
MTPLMRSLCPISAFLLLVAALRADDTPTFVTEPVRRGDVIFFIHERGELEAARSTDIICKVRSSGRGMNIAGSIRWVVDDGTMVKKDEVLMRLDDATLREQLQNQAIVVAEKQTLLRQAEKNQEVTAKEVEHEVKTAEENLELAKLELAAVQGEGLPHKRAQVRLAQAERLLELAKLHGEHKREQVQAEVLKPKALLALDQERLKELQEDLENCTIRAPHEGLVTYYVPEPSRPGAPISVIGVGENVKEAQRLFRIPDMTRMMVRIKIHEALVSQLKRGQAVQVRVAALDQPLTGKVQFISSMASKSGWVGSDVNSFPVLIALDEDNRGERLKPGMSGEAAILVGERRNVLRVPVTAVVGDGQQHFCFVKKGDKHERRRVTLGLENHKFAEITDGLQEGEEVVVNPSSLRHRVVQAQQPPLPHLLVISIPVRDEDPGTRRTFIMKYGLTAVDVDRFRTIPGVTSVVPLRVLPGVLRTVGSARSFIGRMVATTPDYGRVLRLEGRLLAGRFLNEADERQGRNVAVLGAEVAAELFPVADPLGQTIFLEGNSQAFVVIGILAPTPASHPAFHVDKSAHVPWEAARRLVGETIMIRTEGRRIGERVEVHAAVLLGSRARLPAIAAVAREQLERFRPTKDWEIGPSGD